MRPPTISTKSCPPRHIPSIEKCIEELGERFNIREIAFDRWGAVSLKGLALRRDGAEPRRNGLHRCPLRTGFRQYESSHQGIDEAGLGAENRPRRASRSAVEHGQHLYSHRPCRRREASPFRENIKADKAKSTEKIDGAIALIMALDRAIRCGNVNGESIYENRGLLVF